MMPTIYILITLLLPLGLGYFLTLYLTRRNPLPRPFSLAVGYGLGTGILTQWMLFLGVFKIPLTSLTINVPLLVFALILKRQLHNKGVKILSINVCQLKIFQDFNFLNLLMIFYISLNVIYVFWKSFNIPVFSWDAFSVYSFQAKVFFYEQSLRYHPNLPHCTYPLHIPFLQTWIALNLGAWDDQLIKSSFSFYFLFYLIIQYSFLRNFASKRSSLLSLVFLLSSNLLIYHATLAYRDIPMLYYNCTCILLLLNWYKSRDKNILLLISLMAGMLTFNKLEGIGYFFIYIIIFSCMLLEEKSSITKDKFSSLIRLTVPCLAIFLFYQLYLALMVLPKTASHVGQNLHLTLHKIQFQFSLAHIDRLWIIGKVLLNDLFYSNNWNIVWLILFISMFNAPKARHLAETKFLALALVLSLGMYYCGYVFTQHYYWATQTLTVVSRGILPLFPLATMLIILINFADIDIARNIE